MPELDHLIYACPDLARGRAYVAGLTGVEAVAGGPHPGRGTHNALLTFDDRTYFEIIAIDPDQDEPDGPRPFGLTPSTSPGLVGYAIHPRPDETLDDVVALMLDAGFDPGPVAAMSRITPEGTELHWRLTVARPDRSDAAGALPFVIDWGPTPSPARSAPTMGRLVEVRVAHPDPGIRAVAEALGLGLVVTAGAAALTAVVETTGGTVTID